MPRREMVYPNYRADVVTGGDIRLRFSVDSSLASRLGSVWVVLTADDATELLRQIDKALGASDKLLAKEMASE